MTARSSVFLLAALLLGCKIPASPSQPPVSMSLTAKGKAAEIIHTSKIRVNTFENVSKGRNPWLDDRIGVNCVVESPFFKTEFTAPADLIVPTFASDQRPFVTTCTLNGETVSRSSTCFKLRGKDPKTCSYSKVSIIFNHRR
ncbi:hypothetical protein J7443_11560 [Tropicibacter sp. R15_0]|uniref:hypothetical protein n=1 Tax=Tropicibacter sp. R15_0 TaxID=2821101 RepID=UPI001ADC3E4E|nr:hypothetical protein [Tropicibacter sp. R15_0]MBO9465869.1 hypothetical protein [Tropicibacter sp. R15_0]